MVVPEGLALTPFHRYTPAEVDEYIDVYGFAVPLWISDPGSEYDAIRNRVGVLEFSMLYKWDVKGSGAVSVADSVFSRDLATLPVGRVAYGVITDAAGFMIDDCTAMIYSSDHVRLFGGNPASMGMLEGAATDPVTVTEHRSDLAVLSVQGPRSRELLQRLTDTDLSNEAFPYYTFQTGITLGGVEAQVNRLGFTAELGYEVMVAVQDADTIWEAIFKAGEDLGVQACAAAALMMCRVEAGMVMGDLEYDHSVSPYECRMGWCVDLEKAPWIGRDALRARKDADTGRVVTVRVDGSPDGSEAAPLVRDGAEVGRVTMAVPSPVLGGVTIGLARIHRDASWVGTELTVCSEEGDLTAEVISTPVYDPERKRVRS
jgi:aminomethyltransferase